MRIDTFPFFGANINIDGKKFKFHVVFCFFVFFNIGSISAQTASQAAFPDVLATRFLKQRINTLPEKVYLQTDKPYYSAGENIWFKGYVVDAVTHLPRSLSKFLYVELIDATDSVLSRVKIRKDSLGFSGYLKLKPELQAGMYVLRAYTYWMQNNSNDFFFHKNIYIGNLIDNKVQCDIQYGTYLNGKVTVGLTFKNDLQFPISKRRIVITPRWKISGRKNWSFVTNGDGKIFWDMYVDSIKNERKIVNVSIDDEDLKFQKNFVLPDFRNDFDVQFFPESGNLLSDIFQTVGFKAIGTDGLSVDVTGKLFNDKNEEISEFSSEHKGMGKFILATHSGDKYYALIKSGNGIEKRFDLPNLQAQGVVLHLVCNRNRILYEVNNKTSMPTQSLYLLIHSRGMVYAVQPLNSTEGQLSESDLPTGISSFSIVDSLGNTYCERLLFINNLHFPMVDMHADQPSYGARQPVHLQFNIKSLIGLPVSGNFSISVTDSKIVKPDSLQDNIVSYLLLSSDLKGYIENPTDYFVDNSISTHEKADVLMLTQGWKRFNTADVVRGIKQPTQFYIEAGQTLTGKVLNLFEKPVSKADIIMFSTYKSMIRTAKTDSSGNYLIQGFEFPDSTSLVLKARKKGNFGDVEIVPDADVFPKSHTFIPYRLNENNIAPSDYFTQSKDKYYADDGTMMVNLKELTVQAKRKEADTPGDYYSGLADTQLKSDYLDKYPGMNIMDVFQMIPGVMVNGDQISIRGSQHNPLFLIDGIETDNMDDLTYLTTNDVENISVFKGADAAIFGSKGGSGAIAITLKKGVNIKVSAPVSLATIMPLGYQKPIEFYQPKYEVDSIRQSPKPDLRSTIYWNPNLKTDSIGQIQLQFFTADKADDYAVILEGITNQAEICRFTGIIHRKNQK